MKDEILKQIKEQAITTEDLIKGKVVIQDYCDWKNVRKVISLARKSERAKVTKLIDKLCLECPIQEDKECWCKPLELLKKELEGEKDETM